jgi:hypothetical protein
MDSASATLESLLDSSKHIIAELLCPVQRSLTQGFQLPHLCPQIRGSERNGLLVSVNHFAEGCRKRREMISGFSR